MHIIMLAQKSAMIKSVLCVQLEGGDVEITYAPSTDPCPEFISDVSSSSLMWYTCRTSPPEQLQLIISGAADLSTYQQLLRTVAYSNNALEPDKTSLTRNISVSTSSYPLSLMSPTLNVLC